MQTGAPREPARPAARSSQTDLPQVALVEASPQRAVVIGPAVRGSRSRSGGSMPTITTFWVRCANWRKSGGTSVRPAQSTGHSLALAITIRMSRRCSGARSVRESQFLLDLLPLVEGIGPEARGAPFGEDQGVGPSGRFSSSRNLAGTLSRPFPSIV